MKKIAIIGSPGAGKSTFARRIGEITGIEVFYLDQLFWKPGWVKTPRPEWIELQQRIVKGESWIIDGNYGATMDIRIQAADTVIFLDFPRRVCLWRLPSGQSAIGVRLALTWGKAVQRRLTWSFCDTYGDFGSGSRIKL